MSVGIAGREPARIAGVGAPIADIGYQRMSASRAASNCLAAVLATVLAVPAWVRVTVTTRSYCVQHGGNGRQRVISLAESLKRGKRILAPRGGHVRRLHGERIGCGDCGRGLRGGGGGIGRRRIVPCRRGRCLTVDFRICRRMMKT